MCANSEGSGETVRMRRLTWTFTGCLHDKYRNLMSWLILWFLSVLVSEDSCDLWLWRSMEVCSLLFDNENSRIARIYTCRCTRAIVFLYWVLELLVRKHLPGVRQCFTVHQCSLCIPITWLVYGLHRGSVIQSLNYQRNIRIKCKCATSWENLLIPYVNNKDDQPAHPRSLISAFVVPCLDSTIPVRAISKVSRL